MGGSNSQTSRSAPSTSSSELRLHQNNGEVHIHDDSHELKFVMNEKKFLTEIEEALPLLKQRYTALKITGKTKINLYILKDDRSVFMFLGESGSNQQKDLESFIEGM